MLLRQPAEAIKLDVECSICEASSQWVLKEGATFGDLVKYLEEDIQCDCGSHSDSSEDEELASGDDESEQQVPDEDEGEEQASDDDEDEEFSTNCVPS